MQYGEHWGGPSSPPGGFITNIDAMVALSTPEDSGPGFWSDAQQLEVCNFGEGNEFVGPDFPHGMTLEEYRSQYSIWAMFASPLVLSADLRTVKQRHPDCLAMAMNRELLAVAMDPLGTAGKLIHQQTNLSSPAAAAVRSANIVEQAWARPLSGGAVALCLFNRDERPRNVTVSWTAAGLAAPPQRVRDIWRFNSHGSDLAGPFGRSFSAMVPKHSVVMVRAEPK